MSNQRREHYPAMFGFYRSSLAPSDVSSSHSAESQGAYVIEALDVFWCESLLTKPCLAGRSRAQSVLQHSATGTTWQTLLGCAFGLDYPIEGQVGRKLLPC